MSDKIDWKKIHSDLKTYNWNLEFTKKPPTEILQSFYSICFDITSKHVPERTHTLQTNQSMKLKLSVTDAI